MLMVLDLCEIGFRTGHLAAQEGPSYGEEGGAQAGLTVHAEIGILGVILKAMAM